MDIHKSANYKGYTAILGENTDSSGLGDLHEGFDLGWEALESGTTPGVESAPRNDGVMAGGNVWPDGLSGFKETVLDY